jgi:hypothetical protein
MTRAAPRPGCGLTTALSQRGNGEGMADHSCSVTVTVRLPTIVSAILNSDADG